MKIILISILGIITLLFTLKPLTKGAEKHYIVIEKFNNIEIREYKKLIYVSYTPKDIKDRNNSFRNVAGYIFGGNKTDTKIDMTSPVVIKLHNNNEMAFIMPEEYTLKNLPEARNKSLAIYEEASKIKACISYSGYSNNNKEKRYIEKLKKQLKKYNISHENDFEVLVYNSPYQFFNRKNEIIVSIKYNNEILQKLNEKNLKTIHLGGGCFWCIEAIFEGVIGIQDVTSGFSGGKIKNPSYKEVSNGLTEHAEVCKIIYNETQIRLKDILKIFFLSHDPTTLNKQGNDIGKHYRSVIFYKSKQEQAIISNYIDKINKEIFDNQIVTEVTQFNNFYKAEEYHQDYYQQNMSENYCRLVITPKVLKAKNTLQKYYK